MNYKNKQYYFYKKIIQYKKSKNKIKIFKKKQKFLIKNQSSNQIMIMKI